MARIAHTPDSLAETLRTQFRLLATSTTLFDQGHTEQALTMATQLRVLLHDHQQPGKQPTSTSLMKLVGFKDRLRFVDTSFENSPAVLGGLTITLEVEYEDGTREMKPLGQDGLAVIEDSNGEYNYRAMLSRIPDRTYRLPFEPWWTNPIMGFPDGTRYSRWMLVRAMANVAGGAHVDPRGLEESYAKFVRDGFPVWLGRGASSAGDMNAPVEKAKGDPAAVSMRQIAYEFFETIDECVELHDWVNNPV